MFTYQNEGQVKLLEELRTLEEPIVPRDKVSLARTLEYLQYICMYVLFEKGSSLEQFMKGDIFRVPHIVINSSPKGTIEEPLNFHLFSSNNGVTRELSSLGWGSSVVPLGEPLKVVC